LSSGGEGDRTVKINVMKSEVGLQAAENGPESQHRRLQLQPLNISCIDREFEFYEFFSFLKFNEFY